MKKIYYILLVLIIACSFLLFKGDTSEAGVIKINDIDISSDNVTSAVLNTNNLIVTGTTLTDSATLGAELTDATGWTSDGWTGDYDTGFIHTNNNTSSLSRAITGISASKYYQVTYTVSGSPTGYFYTYIGGGSFIGYTNGDYKAGIRTSDATDLIFTPSTTFNGTISAISVKEITDTADALIIAKDSGGDTSVEIRVIDGSLFNTFIGYQAGRYVTTGTSNMGLGYLSCNTLTTGYWNSAIGANSLQYCTTGDENVAIGHKSQQNLISGTGNIALGETSLQANLTGSYNIAIGGDAVYNCTVSSIIGIGHHALFALTTGLYNTSIGEYAGASVVTGASNTIMGYKAYTSGTGGDNSAYGKDALYTATSADSNTVMGKMGMYALTTGDKNTAVGVSALAAETTGSSCIGIGYFAGKYETATQKLFIDSLDRTNEATARTNSMIYGVFNTSVASQYLTLNANVIISRNLTFTTSIDSSAVADEVSLGAYEISAGHRALAISSEEVVVEEVDETKMSHKYPIRINGVNYNLMLTTS